jgi:hypothetical protein
VGWVRRVCGTVAKENGNIHTTDPPTLGGGGGLKKINCFGRRRQKHVAPFVSLSLFHCLMHDGQRLRNLNCFVSACVWTRRERTSDSRCRYVQGTGAQWQRQS